jgi:catechol 2,3-dioxygenase-like lactoylglutathione lyase family enzyme
VAHPISLRFDHVAVPVSDARAAYDLFAHVLELPLIAAHSGDDWDGAPWLMMIFGLAEDGQVALCARKGAKPQRRAAVDLPHFALCVSGDAQLKAWAKRLKVAGFETRREDHGDQRSIYFDDRSGLTWEITTARAQTEIDPSARAAVEEWIGRHS